jgi:hypothetical protein
MVHTYNPSYVRGIHRRLMAQGWLQQKWKTLSENNLQQKGLEV